MMDRVQAPAGISAFVVTVGGLGIVVWALFAIDMQMYLPAILALGMAGVALLSGVVGIWLHARQRQLMGLVVSLSAAFFLALLSVTLLASFAVILLALALLLVIGGSIALSRDASRR